ncbi:MAG: OmpA family protein [Rickettsiales bacterium]|nr:OmpA family protein [Rickettsiales bacterium]
MSSGKKINRKKEDDFNPDEWLITYADAVTLILCFFILMFSVSKPDPDAFKKLAESMQAAGFESEENLEPHDMLAEEMEILIESSTLEETMSVEQTDKGVTLELSSGAFYHGGSAKFSREAIPILKQVAQVLADFDFDAYEIQVDGHTDDVPIKSNKFPSNWELSAARAANIVRFFIAYGITPEIMRAAGYAETRPKVPNKDANGNGIPRNRELNRRIIVRVERVD